MIKKKVIKIFICLFAVILAGGVYSYSGRQTDMFAVDVGAIFEPYKMTDEYKSGKYYKNLARLTLSGDEKRDVLAIAMSQVGYHEGDGDSEMSGLSTSGSRDFVEYNVLAGKYDNDQGNGLSYGYYWCASFVNWCLRMAGVSEDASGGEISCQRWYSDCKDMGIFKSKSAYIPSSADIVFFRDSDSLINSTHVGLVRYSDGAYVYTVEGNTSNGSDYSSNGEYVALKKHALNSKYIVGYATPRYNSNSTAKTVDYSGGFFSLGEYICEQDIEIFSDESLTLKIDSKVPAFSVFSVTEVTGDAVKLFFEDVEAYADQNSGFVQITSTENIYSVNYLNEDGSLLFLPQYRRSGEQKYVYSNAPQRQGHGFVGWVLQSNGNLKYNSGDKLPQEDRDITLVSLWDPSEYTVLFKSADGAVIAEFHGYYGTEYKIPEPPKAPEKYTFYRWSGESECDGVIRGNAEYTASFVPYGEVDPPQSDAKNEKDFDIGNLFGCAAVIPSAIAVIVTSLLGVVFTFINKNKR